MAAPDESFVDFLEFASRASDLCSGKLYAQVCPDRRRLLDRENPMECYSNDGFLLRYRFTKSSVLRILSELSLECATDNRGHPLPSLLKLLATLRFYGAGAFQTVIGDLVGISQSATCNAIWTVTRSIASVLYPKYVRFPLASEAASVMTRFYSIAGFQGVTGCIDCTNAPINSPGGMHAEVYRNRKGVFSINVQAITGPELQFFDIVASWPGSVHDRRIFDNSRARVLYEEGMLPGILLGNQGYPCMPFLMTPLSDLRTQSERRYNRSHIKTRNSVERAFGVWKRRFPCLRMKLQTRLERSAAFICACAALHNIACVWNDPCPMDNMQIQEDEGLLPSTQTLCLVHT
ncbi:putative nuclease HARBI1 [Ornithodoros turicata]|uniref:putative nuclease HARBI1 n=1 Tax=Ornithodoros turicata TaxID=34597 RepID=UPI003139877C